ncbi:MAG TPA: hypothetical protein VFG07_07375 [Thermoplasmata archaeon]|nr:hypothetical protein [Thermoplasmata archaeon]
MREPALFSLYPTLFHMAEDGSWPSIQERGLLSTTALLDAYGVQGPQRVAIESAWRPKKVVLRRRALPDAVIRDQIPLRPDLLEPCLVGGVTVREWYRLINGRVFFWPDRRRLQWFLSAKEYRGEPHIVLTMDTRSVVQRHREKITLSQINSGSAYPSKSTGVAPKRGPSTFQPIAEYPFQYAAELVVEGGIPQVNGLVRSVERWVAHKSGDEEAIYELLERIWP